METKRKHKAIIRLLLFFLFIPLIIVSTSAETTTQDTLLFKWAFIHSPKNGKAKIIDFKQKPSISCGDSLQLFLQPLRNTYIYLYLFDSKKELDLIFPENIDFYTKNYQDGIEFFIPADTTQRFLVDDNIGMEQFYLLASSKRLIDLENITKKYLKNRKNMEIMAELLEKIKTLRRKYSGLTTTVEKGIPIAGTIRTRGTKTGMAGMIIQVKAINFYGKTLRLKHE